MGVAVRMAAMDLLARNLRAETEDEGVSGMTADLSFPGPNAPRTIFVFKLDIDPNEVEAWSKPDEAGTCIWNMRWA